MVLLVGLGNFEPKYEDTPHNAGWRAVRALMESEDMPEPEPREKFKALVAEGSVAGRKVLCVFPTTYMNNSGEAVSALAAFYKVKPEDVWVAHDDADLPVGAVRVALGGGAAGHHGVESVAEKLGTPNFWRFRVGIGRDATLPLDAYVLSRGALAPGVSQALSEKAAGLLRRALVAGPEAAQAAGD